MERGNAFSYKSLDDGSRYLLSGQPNITFQAHPGFGRDALQTCCRYNYLPLRFLVGVKSGLSFPVEPGKGPVIYNDALDLCGSA